MHELGATGHLLAVAFRHAEAENAAADADRALAILQADPAGAGAVIIGRVLATQPGLVTMRSQIGANRILDRFSGKQLPRIC